MRKRKHNPQSLKRLRRLVEMNLSHHAVLFTISLQNAYFVNLKNPRAKTHLLPETTGQFDPDSPFYQMFRFNWRFYPVIVKKDAFGQFDKQIIVDTGYDLVNAHYKDAIEEALHIANTELDKVEPRWRMNAGIIFCIDKTPMTQAKIEEILSMDKDFYIWDPDREISTESERKAEAKALYEALEKVA